MGRGDCLTFPIRGGCSSGTRVRPGRPPLPRDPRACSGAAAAGAGLDGPGAAGAGVRGPGECGDRDPSALRLRLEPRVRPLGGERPRVRVCVCAPAAAERGGGGRDPLPTPPPDRPPPQAPYSAWLPGSAPCAAVPDPASATARLRALARAPAPVPARMLLRSSSGSDVAGGAPLRLCLLSAQGRGVAEEAGPCRAHQLPAIPSRGDDGFPGPALPCPAAAPPGHPRHGRLLWRPRWRRASRALAALRCGSGASAALPPGSFLRWGDAGEGEGRAAPLCAQLARRPHSGWRGGCVGEAKRCGRPARQQDV